LTILVAAAKYVTKIRFEITDASGKILIIVGERGGIEDGILINFGFCK
jgi:hypothetical protein